MSFMVPTTHLGPAVILFKFQQLCFPTYNTELASYQLNGFFLAIIDRSTR
jgi:hypothetical protein